MEPTKSKTKEDVFNWLLEESKKDIREILGSQHNPRINWYHSFTTLRATEDEVPWCSSVLCAAAESCGFKSTRSAAARSWLKYGVEGSGEVGDIVIFSRGNNPKSGHVGVLASPYRKGDKLLAVLGGNQSNMLRVSNYPAERLLAIRRFEA